MTPEEQKKFITDNAMTMPLKRIAKAIGRSGTFVKSEMERQGIHVPDAVRSAFRKQSHYKKGSTPYNKGKKAASYMSPEGLAKIKETSFKKGRTPHNTRKDYDLSLRKSHGRDYYYIRISLGQWVLCHRWIWEQVNGVIPEGHNIQFKDGDSSNFNLDNLYMISRKQQAVINHEGGKSIPFELQETILLLKKIKQSINEKQNHRP